MATARVVTGRKRHASEDSNEAQASNSTVAGPAGDSQDPYVFADKVRETVCLRGFGDLYDAEHLFDLTIKTGDLQFHCHRSFLAASSDYFRAMFTTNMVEQSQSVVNITGIDSTSMGLVIRYLYTGRAELRTSTVQNLLSAANLFQLKELKDGCASFMAKKLDTENCIGIHFFAQAHECEKLEFDAWDWITESFDCVSETAEFLELSADNLIEVIKYDDIHASEEEVYEAANRWLCHASDVRCQDMYDVFSHIRFALIDKYYFFDKVKTNPLLQNDPRMVQIFEEVVMNNLLKRRWLESDLRLEPRYGSDFCRVIAYTSYLDDEKKQVLQIYGQRSDEVTTRHNSASVLCDLPCDIENPALLVTGDNDLYLAGGDNCNLLYKYMPENQEFEPMACMPFARKQFSLVQVDHHIYAVGGCNKDGNLTRCEKYREDTDEWEVIAPMPKALRCCCATSYRGRLYVFGGECEKTSNKKVQRGRAELNKQTFCYDPREGKWTTLAEMNTARALAGCAVFRNKIYVIGGFGTITDTWVRDKSPENCLSSVEIYEPDTNSWTHGPDLPAPLCAMGVVKYYGTIYILGGENDDDVSYNVYYLSDELKWEHKDEMVTGVTETTLNTYYGVLNLDIE